MSHRLVVPFVVLGLFGAEALPLQAQTETPKPAITQSEADLNTAIFEALGLPEMLDIMRAEGLVYGQQIGDDLLGGSPALDWDSSVAAIYDPVLMRRTVEAELDKALAGADHAAILSFFTTEPGRTAVALEVSARRALLDKAVEQMAKDSAAIALADRTERSSQVQRFMEVNDLIETNVTGALNANYAFYIGLQDGGGFPQVLSTDEILADVWSQEPQIRDNTTEWLYAFLMLAYQPMTADDLDTYIAFSETPAGQDLNRAIFVAMDKMFEDISRALGVAASRAMVGADL